MYGIHRYVNYLNVLIHISQQIIECSEDVLRMLYRVIEHSSVNVRLMLTNILRQKVGNSSERSQNVPS